MLTFQQLFRFQEMTEIQLNQAGLWVPKMLIFSQTPFETLLIVVRNFVDVKPRNFYLKDLTLRIRWSLLSFLCNIHKRISIDAILLVPRYLITVYCLMRISHVISMPYTLCYSMATHSEMTLKRFEQDTIECLFKDFCNGLYCTEFHMETAVCIF